MIKEMGMENNFAQDEIKKAVLKNPDDIQYALECLISSNEKSEEKGFNALDNFLHESTRVR